MLFIDQGRSLQNKDISVPIPRECCGVVIGPPTERSKVGIQYTYMYCLTNLCDGSRLNAW